MEQHSVSRLVGAPPGYVGFDDGGQLTEAVRRRPYSVVLFDEMEKAHPDVFNILLQLLDDGRLTDSKGVTVNFRNTIVVFTSNVGSSDILDVEGSERASTEAVRDRVMEALKARFRPEFLNRIDEFVTFDRLGLGQLEGIVGIELNKVNKRLSDKELSLSTTEGAKAWLAQKGFDPVFGARPLKRTIQREVETPIAKKLLGGKIAPGSTLLLDAQTGDDVLTISVVQDVSHSEKAKASSSEESTIAASASETRESVSDDDNYMQ
jgi:ATP-dependent Clp protease ATP-binding subunit ClpB